VDLSGMSWFPHPAAALAAAAGEASDGGHFLESLARSLIQLFAGFLGGFPAVAHIEEASYRQLLAHGAASAVILGIVLTFHAGLFAILRRRIERRRQEQGSEDDRVLVLEALGRPLKLAYWLCGVYLAVLPLLLLVDPNEALYPVRPALEKIVEVGLFAAIYWFFYRSVTAGEIRLRRWLESPPGSFQDTIVGFVGNTFRIVIPVAALISGLPLLGLPPAYDYVIGKVSSLLIIGAVARMLFSVVNVGERFVISRYSLTDADNLKARQIYTQVHILRKTLYLVITILTVSAALMLFEQVRSLGTSVLASAGVVGIIIGFAAQRTIANLFAGFQLALTQPIRIDDVVIVENEWGRIEEITLTYVVVRIWDMRRLIVPLSQFIERPFQNWTRVTADILGTVFIYADYTIPVDAVREELKRIVAQSSHWDGKVCGLQVTNATERTVELRALASAADASKAWDLRCEIREKLITFIQQNFPDSLPRVRADVGPRHGAPPANSPRDHFIGFAPAKA
jgi:small-conductance mechanosensitive channel